MLSIHRVAALALAATSVASAREIPLPVLLSQPQRFHHQRVTTSGFAVVSGESFELYPDGRTAARYDVHHALCVGQRISGPRHDQFNRHWIIDAQAHCMWGNPCELLLERVTAATRATSNQSMQLTAGRSATSLPVTSTSEMQQRSPSPAVADLVSR
jgi:hypothetical protein